MDRQAYVDEQESVLTMGLQFVYRALVICVRFVLVRIYGERGQSIPSIGEPLLLQPATSIAEKIRTKQVITHFAKM